MIDIRNKIIYVIAVFVLIVIINNVHAFGVSYSYLCPDNPVIVNPGKETKVAFGLQNMNVQEGEDMNVFVRFKNNEGIASLENDKYLVKANTKDTKVYVDLKIPNEAEIGKNYNVVLDFSIAPKENAEGVVFGLGNEVKMCVLVGRYILPTLSPEEIKGKNSKWILMGLGILIIIVLAIIIVILRRKNKEKYKGWQRGRWGR